jgi:hypothetical protein
MFSRKKAQNKQKLNNHFCAFVPVCGYFQAQLREQRSGSFPGNRIGVCSTVPLVAPAQLVSSTIPSPINGRVNAVGEARRRNALRSIVFKFFISILPRRFIWDSSLSGVD